MEILDWDVAKQEADNLGLVVAATYKLDGTPVYFLIEPEAEDDDVRDTAFTIRNGRTFSEAERFYMKLGLRLANQD